MTLLVPLHESQAFGRAQGKLHKHVLDTASDTVWQAYLDCTSHSVHDPDVFTLHHYILGCVPKHAFQRCHVVSYRYLGTQDQ